jgi:hypothetical protein
MTQPIYRVIYRAQSKAGLETTALRHFQQRAAACTIGCNPGDLMTLAIFRWGIHFFVYVERIQTPITADMLFDNMDDWLESWPGQAGPRCFVPMMDIFHCLEPESVDHWRRKQAAERIGGRVARLQPEMVSSYIFYHYQLQEEKPGSFDKYGLISLHEDLIFFYQEFPALVELPLRRGKLTTTNTPDHWHEVMFPHFHLWEDAPAGQEIWRDVTLVLHRSALA